MVLFLPVGPKGDRFSAQVFMHNMFMGGIPPEKVGQFFPHFTCATVTQNIKKVFDGVRNTIMVEYMTGLGTV